MLNSTQIFVILHNNIIFLVKIAVCEKSKLPPMRNHGAAVSFIIAHFLQRFKYA